VESVSQLKKKTEDDLRQLIQAKGTSGVNEPIAKHNNIVEEEEKHKEQQPAQPDEKFKFYVRRGLNDRLLSGKARACSYQCLQSSKPR
jgi:hypothetical protein